MFVLGTVAAAVVDQGRRRLLSISRFSFFVLLAVVRLVDVVGEMRLQMSLLSLLMSMVLSRLHLTLTQNSILATIETDWCQQQQQQLKMKMTIKKRQMKRKTKKTTRMDQRKLKLVAIVLDLVIGHLHPVVPPQDQHHHHHHHEQHHAQRQPHPSTPDSGTATAASRIGAVRFLHDGQRQLFELLCAFSKEERKGGGGSKNQKETEMQPKHKMKKNHTQSANTGAMKPLVARIALNHESVGFVGLAAYAVLRQNRRYFVRKSVFAVK